MDFVYNGWKYWGSDSESKKSRYKSSLGWGSDRLFDTITQKSYSSFLYKKSSSFEEEKKSFSLLSKIYKDVKDLIIILDFPYKIKIGFGNSKYTGDYKTVFIPTIVLDDLAKDDLEKTNIICGLGIHEASHLKYTDKMVFKRFYATYESIASIFANIIEDERVEDLLLTERPGYFEFIQKERDWCLEETKKKGLPELLFNLISFIRYHEEVNPKVIESNEDLFREISNIVNDSVSTSTKESCEKGLKIEKVLLKYLDPKTFNKYKILCSELLNVTCFDLDISYDKDRKLVSNILSNPHINGLLDGIAEFGDENYTYFIKQENGNKIEYNALKREIQTYIPKLRKILLGSDKNYDFNIYGCRSGLLDTTKLAEAYQGVQQVYVRQGHVKTNKTTLCILVDESGSMRWSDLDIIAKKAIILINEAMKDVPGIDLYIYGHTADEHACGETVLYTYKEGDKFSSNYNLTKIRGKCENRDGTAILSVAERVRKFTDSHCIMLVLSDGEPAAMGYNGIEAREDTRNKVNKVTKMGFDVIQVSIDDIYDAKSMFDNVICLQNDVANLPKNLSSVVKNLVTSDKKTITT